MIRTGMHILCTLHAQTMRMICAVVLMGGPAQAGVWEEFEARCLGPMENVAPFDFSGMHVVTKHALADHKDTVEWQTSEGVSLHHFAEGTQCTIDVMAADARELARKAKGFIQEAVVAGRYVHSGKLRDGERYLSTSWREPKLEISLKSRWFYTTVTIRETDLES